VFSIQHDYPHLDNRILDHTSTPTTTEIDPTGQATSDSHLRICVTPPLLAPLSPFVDHPL